MADDWCVAVEAASPAAAEAAEELLKLYRLDVESTGERVLCFAESRDRATTLARRISVILRESPYPDELGEPRVQRWSGELQHYADAETPGEDPAQSDLDPGEIRWRVRVELESFFDHWKVRRRLRPLARPEYRSGRRFVDLGAFDEDDARSIAMQARDLDGVHDAVPSPIHGWFERWLVRQRLVGNYGDGWGGGP